MHLDDADLAGFADAAERSFEVAGLDRASGPGGEYKSGVRPCRSDSALVPSLPFGLASERFTGQVEERQGTLAGMSLNRCEKDLAAKRAAAGGGSGVTNGQARFPDLLTDLRSTRPQDRSKPVTTVPEPSPDEPIKAPVPTGSGAR